MSLENEFNKIDQIRRNIAWCTQCGRSQPINGAKAMLNGWPKCCGYTMTIDSPEERERLKRVLGEQDA